MTIPLEKIAGMPAFSPYYPLPPTRYRNLRAHYIAFRADVSALDRVLPECFEPSPDGFCMAFGLTVPWSSSYGAFEESGLFVRCRYEGQVGYFAPAVFSNSRARRSTTSRISLPEITSALITWRWISPKATARSSRTFCGRDKDTGHVGDGEADDERRRHDPHERDSPIEKEQLSAERNEEAHADTRHETK